MRGLGRPWGRGKRGLAAILGDYWGFYGGWGLVGVVGCFVHFLLFLAWLFHALLYYSMSLMKVKYFLVGLCEFVGVFALGS